jgi:sulfatase maturation enzyme AslB (radical SAM superfamily)
MNDYFCVLPFFSYESTSQHGKNIYCCELAPGADIKRVQGDIKKQKRSPACAVCWKMEDQGLPSQRQIHNQTFDFYTDRDIELIEQDAVDHGFIPKIIKISTSNLCNATCVTCGFGCSTAWAKLENRPINYRVVDLGPINWSKIVQLSFVGGEPLLEKKNFDILQSIIDSKNTNCFISIVTNGSIELTPTQFDILSKFTNLNICLSIDGIGPSFEYIRWPLKWETLTHNLDKFQKITPNLSVSCMISNLNIFYYSELIDFFNAKNLKYLCKQIHSPEWFSPGNLPDLFKLKVIEHNPRFADEVRAFLNCAGGSIEQFWTEITRQDQLKNIDIQNFLPELSSTRI